MGSWDKITNIGNDIREKWRKLATKYQLEINIWGIPALSGFTFNSYKSQSYKTLITQEMLKKGFLAANSIYVCTEHTPQKINKYFEALDPVFGIIKNCEDGLNINSILTTPVCHDGFKRL